MSGDLKSRLNSVLSQAVADKPGVPGVVAALTDRTGTLYEGVAGLREIGGAPMTFDTLLAVYSCTKAVTGAAALQCHEEGLLDLDAPAAQYVPEIEKLWVLDGFDAEGRHLMRPPKAQITTRMLLLHTSGLAYDFTSPLQSRWSRETGHRRKSTMMSIYTPLVADPGERWCYGGGIEWVGLVVEAARRKRLGEVVRQRILGPLDMKDTAWTPSPAAWERRAGMHLRERDGSLRVAQLSRALPQPEIDLGGTGLYSTVGDYMKFIRMWLNEGLSPAGRILKAETVKMATRNGLTRAYQNVGVLEGSNPVYSNRVEFFPGVKKGWGLTFLINEEEAPTGRPAGSLSWAGLSNVYYWIDMVSGFGGLWAAQILPFGDPASQAGFQAFETAFYQALARP